jgi:acyl carrier protein
MLPSGKVNKYDLPVPDDIRSQLATEFIAPRTDTENVLAEIVSDILKIDKVGVNDSFFELGGHSMMATQVISRIREEFKIEVPLRSLFEAPTVAGIAISITEIQAEFEDKEDLSAMLDELDGLSEEEVKRLLEEEKEE